MLPNIYSCTGPAGSGTPNDFCYLFACLCIDVHICKTHNLVQSNPNIHD